MHKFFANTLFIGKKVIYLPTCHSTNDIAASLVPQQDIYEGTVIITDHQTSGKGQRGNSWEAEPSKNLTFSIILQPALLQISNQFFLNIIISLALHDYLTKQLTGIKIKWPNDIYFYDNKIGGILIENAVKAGKIESVIAGIGLNINQTKFRYSNAISLAQACRHEFDKEAVLEELLMTIEARYLQLKAGAFEKLKKEYLTHLYWREEEHIFKEQDFFNGKIKGIDNNGKLGVEVNNEMRYFDVKEIKFIK